jgi:hypothetical protein
MQTIKLIAKSFKKMDDPTGASNGHIKYVCYVKANSIPQTMNDWFATNPREQKMSTNVAKKITESLKDNENFHELNRGVLLSAYDVKYDNASKELLVSFDNPEVHGNIDGGHTLRAILNANAEHTLNENRYVFFEIITGIESPVELAAARNTSVQVDLKSIAELENSFEEIKLAFDGVDFANRIQYKMNEHYNDSGINPIDVREIIAITAMFSQSMYPFKTSQGTLNETQPIQCYSGKETTLRKFLNMDSADKKQQKVNRDVMVKHMRPIIKDIFLLWEMVECEFAATASSINKRYGTRKYSKYHNGETVGYSMFGETPLMYIVPKGLLYPLVGSFRALVQINEQSGLYEWKKHPVDVWKAIGSKLVAIVLDEKAETPDALAKNSNLWSNLFKEIYIYAYMN